MKPREFSVSKIFIRWLDSAHAAIEGILYAIRTQPHIRFHLAAAFVVLLLCFMIGLTASEFALIALIILLVIVAEMFNSALETAVDLMSPKANELARQAKDMAAGAVLVSSFGALVVGYIILAPYIKKMITGEFQIARHTAENIAILAVISIILIVVMVKVYSGSGRPLRGGFPSGHSAVAFSIWVVVALTSHRLWLNLVVLGLALAVSLSRLHRKIHSLRDIVYGALLGIAVTYILFRIFY